ncbi:MAG: type II toxin-antitoxin system RelE/ParE family toxin [Pseudomonadota bacterium]
MHARLTEDAEADLDAIKEYLEPRSPQGLQRILSAIFTTIGQLETFPFLGHGGRVGDTREIAVPRTPFVVIYSTNEDDPYYIDIDRILHGRMKYPPEEAGS